MTVETLNKTQIDQDPLKIIDLGQIFKENSEVYGRSLSGLRQLGKVALLGEFEDSQERVREHEFALFESHIGEMIKTDAELSDQLEITRWDEYDFNEAGEVIGYDGRTTLVELTERGYLYSQDMAQKDIRVQTQASRDYQDWQNAIKVNKLQSGEVRIVASLAPEEAIKRDGENFWQKLGYMPDKMVSFLQVYYHNGDKLVAGTLSVDNSDKKQWRKVFAKFGVDIPKSESTDNWLQYAIEQKIDMVDVLNLAEAIRSSYCKQNNESHYRKSIDQFLKENREILAQNFDSLYEELAKSAVLGAASPIIEQVAQKILNQGDKVDSDLLYHMNRFVKHGYFDDEIIRCLERSIRYATVEEIRAKMTGRRLQVIKKVSAEDFLNNFDDNFGDGVKNGREYGGCGSESGITGGSALMSVLGIGGPQEVFGGSDVDKYGSLFFDCPKGHKNKRPYGKLIPRCQTCGTDVRC